MTHTPTIHRSEPIIDRGSLRTHEARIYARIGGVLMVALAFASLLVWTGVWGQMLTWGDWGTLSVADLLGFLIIAGVLVSLGLFVLLFTMRSALRQVEADLRVADHKVDQNVARFNRRVEELEARSSRLLAQERVETARQRDAFMEQMRHEAAEQLTATRRTAARAARAAFETAEAQLRHRLATEHPDRAEIARLTQVLEEAHGRLEAIQAEKALFEETIDERTHVIQEAQEKEALELRAGLIRTRAELLRTLHDEVQQAVSQRDARASHGLPAGRGERFYTRLGSATAAGLALALFVVAIGLDGPGILSSGTAFVALGAAVGAVALGLLALTFSFSAVLRRRPETGD